MIFKHTNHPKFFLEVRIAATAAYSQAVENLRIYTTGADILPELVIILFSSSRQTLIHI